MTNKYFWYKTTPILVMLLFLVVTTSSFKSSDIADNLIQHKPISTAFGYLKLNLNSNSLNYNTEIYFNSNATQGLDPGYDSSIIGGTAPAFSIYSFLVQNDTGIPFAVQALSNTDLNNVTVPLGISASNGQNATISIAESDISESINIYLENRSNNTTTLLNTNAYSFTFDTSLLGVGHFYLKFEGDALSQNQESLEDIKIYTEPNQKAIIISGEFARETNFKIYDINGRLMSSNNLDHESSIQIIDTPDLDTGVYIVELENNLHQKRTQKIIIQ